MCKQDGMHPLLGTAIVAATLIGTVATLCAMAHKSREYREISAYEYRALMTDAEYGDYKTKFLIEQALVDGWISLKENDDLELTLARLELKSKLPIPSPSRKEK